MTGRLWSTGSTKGPARWGRAALYAAAGGVHDGCMCPGRAPSIEDVTFDVLRRQHLAGATSGANVVDVARDLVGLHGTDAASPHLQLLARLPGFTRDHLEHELYHRRTLVLARCMRGTLFILPVALLEIAWAATRELVVGPSRRYLAGQWITPAAYRRWAAAIDRLLQGRALSASAIRTELRAGGDIPIPVILNQMCDDGYLLRDEPVAGWRDPRHTYRRFDECLPDAVLDRYERDEAIALLVERYIARYGPVTIRDIGWWTGLGVRRTRAALQRLGGAVVATDLPGWTGQYVVRAEDLNRLTDSPTHEDPQVAVLPMLDPFTMGYRDRERLIHPHHHNLVYDGSGNATNSLLVCGRIAGVWDVVDEHDEVRYHPLASWPSDLERQVRDLLARTASFIVARPVRPQRTDHMVPLTQRRRGWVKKPLHVPP